MPKVNDGYARNDHAKFSRALDAYFIQEQKSIDLQTFIPSVFYRLRKVLEFLLGALHSDWRRVSTNQ